MQPIGHTIFLIAIWRENFGNIGLTIMTKLAISIQLQMKCYMVAVSQSTGCNETF